MEAVPQRGQDTLPVADQTDLQDLETQKTHGSGSRPKWFRVQSYTHTHTHTGQGPDPHGSVSNPTHTHTHMGYVPDTHTHTHMAKTSKIFLNVKHLVKKDS